MNGNGSAELFVGSVLPGMLGKGPRAKRSETRFARLSKAKERLEKEKHQPSLKSCSEHSDDFFVN